MNKNNENLDLKQSFFGYNLYSSSFSYSPKNVANQKSILEKKSAKNKSNLINDYRNQGHKRYNSETYNKNKASKKSSNKYFTSLLTRTNEDIINEQDQSNISNNSHINQNMKVMVRIRPPLPREIEFDIPFRSISEVSSDNKMIIIYEYLGSSNNEIFRQHEFIQNPSMFQQHRFTFDYIFDQDSTQVEIYLKAAKPSVQSLLEGYNSTILAYGQTGTGKTYTMEGFTLVPFDDKRGLVPRVVEDIFLNTSNREKNADIKFSIRTSYLQIYNEYISDLLIPEKKNLNIREDKKKGIFVDGLSEWIVTNPNDIYTLLGKGTDNRAISSTTMNEISSRSHAIFVITLEQEIRDDNSLIKKISKLNLVDLAGSERTRITGAKGKQLEESKKINRSLSALGNVINALTETKGNNNHIPYRDSKLTRLLEDSLGGNCITTLITMISPCQNFINETLSSLCFARRAKKIKNKPKINQQVSRHQALIKQYEIILRKMKEELLKKDEIINDNKLIKQINQLTEEKNNIIKQLELTSENYLKEKEEKKILEKTIEIIKAENKKNENIDLESTPQFKKVMEEKQKILLKEFDDKITKYKNEKENSKINNNNNIEIDRYKNLILKQREIMSDLTKKINERDETIIQLQEEKDLLEKINEQQNYYLTLLNKNYKNLIEYCKTLINNQKESEETLENYINIYNKINNEVLNKYESKENIAKNTRKYLRYNYSIDNTKISNNSVLNSSMSSINNLNLNNEEMSLLTPEEKINELNSILKEKENEIKILKIFSQKFLSNSCESNEGKINLEQIKHDFQNGFELYSKLREIEEEKNMLKNENEQLRNKMAEYQNNFFKMHNILSDINLTDENKANKKVNDLNMIVKQLINNNIDNLIKENTNDILENDKNNFNQKIQDIIKEKNENLMKIANSLNNIQLIKTQTPRKKIHDEKKFINKFITSDK